MTKMAISLLATVLVSAASAQLTVMKAGRLVQPETRALASNQIIVIRGNKVA
jgi:hypothetical protein